MLKIKIKIQKDLKICFVEINLIYEYRKFYTNFNTVQEILLKVGTCFVKFNYFIEDETM